MPTYPLTQTQIKAKLRELRSALHHTQGMNRLTLNDYWAGVRQAKWIGSKMRELQRRLRK